MQQLERQRNNARGPSVAEFFLCCTSGSGGRLDEQGPSPVFQVLARPFQPFSQPNLGFILHDQLIDKSKLDAPLKQTCAESTEGGEKTAGAGRGARLG